VLLELVGPSLFVQPRCWVRNVLGGFLDHLWPVDLEAFDDDQGIDLFDGGAPCLDGTALADLAGIQVPEPIEDLRMIKRYFSISNLIIFIIFILICPGGVPLLSR
jgi:hypothetical protein